MADTDCRMSSDRPLTVQESIIAARAFPGSGTWVVDNYNCLAALLALADRQPSELYLIARDDAEEDMPIEVFQEISKRVKKCQISMRFIDSFLKPCSTYTDRRRLELLVDNKSFTYDRFYGYPDASVITKAMMHSFVSFGLAIKNAADAAQVGRYKFQSMNPALKHLNISVSSEVAVEVLEPLDESFHGKLVYLTFPYLTDEYVNNVRPAIERLATNRGVAGIFFPKSGLTGAGARRLASQLVGARVDEVSIDPCETWKLDQKEKDSIKEMLLKVVPSEVVWDVNWMYEISRK